jgi:uncharacterized membrane protein YhaH (DUF805 family)
MGNTNFGAVLFSFHGRINRARFWLTTLVYVIAAGSGLLHSSRR